MAGHASPVPSRGAAGWPPERRWRLGNAVHLRAPFGESWLQLLSLGDRRPLRPEPARASLPTVQDAEFRLDEVFAGLKRLRLKYDQQVSEWRP